ncbi:MAG: bifunctional [glutamate--ammonia ligase]-adenylyl-L-tyrosine phosphorylase/[glutamate--ammonia-ligase] adenylyltransferase [Verrucomicrobia bacterium]|nr:MAG: bifunctional [glutamate--ammonia ligase]-adenylyl-L-tyrosine phosphorylase/[glutamate--ammonia-ligase] adenylyltransferase [Verrucomicrobiota bacterium]
MANAPWPEWAERHLAMVEEADADGRLAGADPEQARILAALLSGSRIAAERLRRRPEWLEVLLDVEGMKRPRRRAVLRREVEAALGPRIEQGDYTGALNWLRSFRARESTRIAARDLAGLAGLPAITEELSDLADVCLEAVYQICWRRLVGRLGEPWHQGADGEWQRTAFSVIGLGKLGGRELNYSSDVDLMFLYEEEGWVFREPPEPGAEAGRRPPSHEFFRRLAGMIAEEVGRATAEGQLYRVDLRLRPEGDAGPLARSLDSCETYYAQQAQVWERLMLMRARGVAGDTNLAGEFLELIQPFRYPRHVNPACLQDISRMKLRLETEIVRSEALHRNIKLGRGGIREVEFVVQSLQLLHAGRTPFIAEPRILPALDRLTRYGLLSQPEARALAEAYTFYRNLEHRLQMAEEKQTHTLPEDENAVRRLARLMGFADEDAFRDVLAGHQQRVREIYDRVLPSPAGEEAGQLPPLEEGREQWLALLQERRFRDPERAWRMVQEWIDGPGHGLVTPATREAARMLLEKFLERCPRQEDLEALRRQAGPDGDPEAKWLSDPDRVLARLLHYMQAYGSRAGLLDTWRSNLGLFELMLWLFDRSEFLAELSLSEPDLVESLARGGYLVRSKTAAQTLEELRLGRDEPDARSWLRRYHRAEFMRIGLRDILGLADFEQHMSELSALAEACLAYAMEVLGDRHGGAGLPVAVIGLGKLGGGELNYGSDLDVLLVAADEAPDPAGLQRVGAELMDLIAARTEHGVAFELDLRLRPDGEKGLLVPSLSACESYYTRRAWLWEIQALSRARPVAGDPEVGRRFMELVQRCIDFREPDPRRVKAMQPDWRLEMVRMRQRIERERVKPGHEPLAFKTGAGGLVDAEFIAQAICLGRGWLEPNTGRALERAGREGALPPELAAKLLENYRRLRRIEAILRRWSYEGETELPVDPAARYRVAVRCGFGAAEDLLAAVARYRAHIREVYREFFAPEWRELGEA